MEFKKGIETLKEIMFSRKNNPGDIIIPDFKIYYRFIVIKKQYSTIRKTDMFTNGTKNPGPKNVYT